MEEVVELLIKLNKTIGVMESCTGGGISNAITNVSGSSLAFNYGAVTYSNEYKIKMGVPSDIITEYTVYSSEVAIAMAKAISNYTNSNYGVGVTGKLKKFDEANPYGEDDIVYLAIYDRDNDICYNEKIKLISDSRIDCKTEIINILVNKMKEIIK